MSSLPLFLQEESADRLRRVRDHFNQAGNAPPLIQPKPPRKMQIRPASVHTTSPTHKPAPGSDDDEPEVILSTRTSSHI